MPELMLRDPLIALEDPLAEMRRALDRLDRSWFWGAPSLFAAEAKLAVDIREEGGTYIVETAVPGFAKDEIDVGTSDGVLTIRAEREGAEERAEERYLYRERYRGPLDRRIALSGLAAEAEVDATLKDGVLTLRIPIAEKAKARRIEITEA